MTGGGAFLASLDVSLANGLLPRLGRDLRIDASGPLSWVISVYAVVFAATLVPAGRLADRLGRRRAFRQGMAMLAVGSLVCAAANDLPVMLLGRALQAVGASAASPASLGLLVQDVDPPRRPLYAARWAGVGALGIASGPIVGGIAVAGGSWRSAFLFSALVASTALVAVGRVTGETALAPGRRLPDPTSAVLLATGAAALCAGITEAGERGPDSWTPIGLTLAGVLLFAGLVRRCLRVSDPVLDLRLLRVRVVSAATVVTLLYSAAFFGLVYSFMAFLQQAWQLSLMAAGLAMLPIPCSVMAVTTQVGRVVQGWGFRLPIMAGVLLMAGGLLAVGGLADRPGFSWAWLGWATVVGVGSGLSFPLLSAASVSTLPATELAAASALNQCARQVGAALGIALTVLALGRSAGGHGSRIVHGYQVSWAVGVGCCALAAISCWALPSRPRARGPVAARGTSARREREDSSVA